MPVLLVTMDTTLMKGLTPNNNASLFKIRKKGEVDYPTPECGCECYECCRAHYKYRHESALAEEYKRLLDCEKQAMQSAIIAVEDMEKEHAEEIENLKVELETERDKVIKYVSELEAERKLRLTQVYKSEAERRASQSVEAERKVIMDRMIGMQEEIEALHLENKRVREFNDSLKTQMGKLNDRAQTYEMDIYTLEKTNAELRLRLTRR